MGARGHHGTHQLNAPALGILLVLPFLCVLPFWRLERDGRCPKRMLPTTMNSSVAVGVFPTGFISGLGFILFSGFREAAAFQGCQPACHLSVTPSERYGSISAWKRGTETICILSFLPTAASLSSFGSLLSDLKHTDMAPE